jgi:hypothetical protein
LLAITGLLAGLLAVTGLLAGLLAVAGLAVARLTVSRLAISALRRGRFFFFLFTGSDDEARKDGGKDYESSKVSHSF